MLYLAYGSNLHPARLHARLDGGSLAARAIIVGASLRFHKQGADGSGKADLLFTGNNQQTAYGAIYRLSPSQLDRLDHYEGGYRRQRLDATLAGKAVELVTYLANTPHIHPNLSPFAWYRDLVVGGGKALGFNERYLAQLNGITPQPDPDRERAVRHQRLLATLQPINDLEQLLWLTVYSTSISS